MGQHAGAVGGGEEMSIRNIHRVLQANPLNYRHFGCYWWRVKRELGRAGGNDERWPEIDALAEAEFWTLAYGEYHNNAVTQHLENRVFTPDGVAYIIRDTDVEP